MNKTVMIIVGENVGRSTGKKLRSVRQYAQGHNSRVCSTCAVVAGRAMDSRKGDDLQRLLVFGSVDASTVTATIYVFV